MKTTFKTRIVLSLAALSIFAMLPVSAHAGLVSDPLGYTHIDVPVKTPTKMWTDMSSTGLWTDMTTTV